MEVYISAYGRTRKTLFFFSENNYELHVIFLAHYIVESTADLKNFEIS